jgi:phosphatidate cytidylyltransferase
VLRWRLLFGVIFIAALVGICVLDFHSGVAGSWLFPLAFVASLALAKEMINLLTSDTQQPIPTAVCIGITAVVASNIPLIYFRDSFLLTGAYEPLHLPLLTFLLSIILVLLAEMRRYRAPGGVIVNAALAVFAIAYVGLLMTATIQLRAIGDNTTGLVALVSLIAVVKFGDIGAYTLGRLFGKHKMAPVLSPGKTMEGAVGAMLFAIIAACVTLMYVPTLLGRSVGYATLPVAVGYGVIVGLAGMFGDLAESLIKRDRGAKDSSSVLPGFGGVFDLLDSILFAAPVALFIWLAILL